MYKKLKKGFTLVELIVVMAIIAILSTVAVVSYSVFIEKANQSRVDSELSQIANVLRAEAFEGEKVELSTAPEQFLELSINEDNEVTFTFSIAADEPHEHKVLFDQLITGFDLSVTGQLTLVDNDSTRDLLKYTVDSVSASMEVVIVQLTA